MKTATGLEAQFEQGGKSPTAPTEGMAEYQQAGEGQLSHITDAAQLTRTLSRASDVDMTPAPATPRPDTHDIATPRRRIGGRCRKWAVSTQAAAQSNKRKCASCTGEPRLQQWANRSTQRACVHAQCITGGIGRDHELVPKVPAENESMDAVIRLRDNMPSAATAVEVFLSIHDQHDDNSTEAPRRKRPTVRQGGGTAS